MGIAMQGSRGNSYQVDYDETNNVVSCTCMAWRTQRRPIQQRVCKHTQRLVAGVLVHLERVAKADEADAVAAGRL